jgi:hypothetical protein
MPPGVAFMNYIDKEARHSSRGRGGVGVVEFIPNFHILLSEKTGNVESDNTII